MNWPDHSGKVSPDGWKAIYLITALFAIGGFFGHDTPTKLIMGGMAAFLTAWSILVKHYESKEP